MTASERTFLDTLQRDTKGRIVYTYRGQIERGARYDWKPGYSATTGANGILYPWMTKRECQPDAKRFETTAVFVESNVGFAA